MRSHSLWPMPPSNTSLSVPRLMPLNSVRTHASPGAAAAGGAVRSSATPFLAYQSERATRTLPVDWRAIILPPRPVMGSAHATIRKADCMSDSLDTSAPGRLPPAALSLTTPTGLQSIDELTRRRQIVFGA